MSLYTLENEAFASLVKYGGLALLKTVAMSPITIFYRLKYNSVPTPEDAAVRAGNDEELKKKLLAKNDEVERVRLYFCQSSFEMCNMGFYLGEIRPSK